MLESCRVRELIEQARAGDREARERAFWGLARVVGQVLSAMRVDLRRDDFQDLEQQGFAALLAAMDTYPLGSAVDPRAWCYLRVHHALVAASHRERLRGGVLAGAGDRCYLWIVRRRDWLINHGLEPTVERILSGGRLPYALQVLSASARRRHVREVLVIQSGIVDLDRLPVGDPERESEGRADLEACAGPGPADIVEHRLMRVSRRRAVWAALAELTPWERSAVDWVYFSRSDDRRLGWLKRLAAQAGVRRGALSVAHGRALRRLRKCHWLREYLY